MSFMKYLSYYTGHGDPQEWLDQYSAAAKSENWKASQILECICLKLKKRAKEWYNNNFSYGEKPKTWESFVTLFLEEFGTEDIQSATARCYKIKQRKTESLKS
jgi:hypothetical protein